MEPQVSLPCSQETATYPFPEPDKKIHTFKPHFPDIHFNINLSSTPGFSPSGTRKKSIFYFENGDHGCAINLYNGQILPNGAS
jgi:hypothetical protein